MVYTLSPSFYSSLSHVRNSFKILQIENQEQFDSLIDRLETLESIENHYPLSYVDSLESKVDIVDCTPSVSHQRHLVIIEHSDNIGGATQLVLEDRFSLKVDSIIVVIDIAHSIGVESNFHYLSAINVLSTGRSSSGLLDALWYPP